MTAKNRSLMENPIAFSPVLAKVFGVCGALLIQQIHYWCEENHNVYEGHSWVWNTSRQWAENLMAFDERTVRYALKKLRESGVVITGTFNKHKYDKTLWYRLNYEELARQLSEAIPQRNYFPHPCGNFFRIHAEEMPAPIPKTTDKTTTEISLATAAPSQGNSGVEEALELGEVDMAKGPSTTSQLLTHLKETQGKPTPSKENSAASLEKVFKTVSPKHNDMTCIPSFTMKDKGQLGRLSKKWGSVADRIMETVCSDWLAFAKDVATTLGMSKYPLVPHLPFIVKYADHAAAFHHASVQLTAPAPVAEPTVETVAVAPPKKKLLIINKKPAAPKPEVVQAPEIPEQADDEAMSLEALLAFGSKLKS